MKKNNSQRTAIEKFQISKTYVSKTFETRSGYLQIFEENENESMSQKVHKINIFEVNQTTF